MQALNQVCVIFAARFWLARSPWALWSVLSSLRPRPSCRVTLTRSRAVPMPLRAVRTRRSSARRRTRTQSPSRSAGEVTRVQAQMRTWTRRHSGLGSVRLSRSRNEGTAVGGGCDVRASSLRAFIYARGRERYSSMTLYTHAQVTSRGTGDAADLRLSIAYILTYPIARFRFRKNQKKEGALQVSPLTSTSRSGFCTPCSLVTGHSHWVLNPHSGAGLGQALMIEAWGVSVSPVWPMMMRTHLRSLVRSGKVVQ